MRLRVATKTSIPKPQEIITTNSCVGLHTLEIPASVLSLQNGEPDRLQLQEREEPLAAEPLKFHGI